MTNFLSMPLFGIDQSLMSETYLTSEITLKGRRETEGGDPAPRKVRELESNIFLETLARDGRARSAGSEIGTNTAGDTILSCPPDTT